MKGWVNMTAKAKRRRYIVGVVEQAIFGVIFAAGYVGLSLIGEALCRLFGAGL